MARTQGTAKFDVRQKLNLGMHGMFILNIVGDLN
jgi:hypothetical protein